MAYYVVAHLALLQDQRSPSPQGISRNELPRWRGALDSTPEGVLGAPPAATIRPRKRSGRDELLGRYGCRLLEAYSCIPPTCGPTRFAFMMTMGPLHGQWKRGYSRSARSVHLTGVKSTY